MLQAIVISNNIHGIENYYQSNDLVQYDFYTVTQHFNPPLNDYDVLVVPNGCDQIAMGKIKNEVKYFLDAGKALICCDGWFTDWVPGNQWKMDISKKSIDVRYAIKDDPYQLFKNIDVDEFTFSHGISGYWACGYIDAAENASVIMEDTWHRPIIVLDNKTTNGIMFLTASGPLGDITYNNEEKKQSGLTQLYKNFIHYLITTKTPQHA